MTHKEHLFTNMVQAGCLNVLQPKLAHVGKTLFGKIRSHGEPTICEIAELTGELISVNSRILYSLPLRVRDWFYTTNLDELRSAESSLIDHEFKQPLVRSANGGLFDTIRFLS